MLASFTPLIGFHILLALALAVGATLWHPPRLLHAGEVPIAPEGAVSGPDIFLITIDTLSAQEAAVWTGGDGGVLVEDVLGDRAQVGARCDQDRYPPPRSRLYVHVVVADGHVRHDLQGVARRVEKLGVHLTKLTDKQAGYIGVPKVGPFKPETYRY